ncbi:Sentrin-specific protease 1, partial [Fasciolopsis buskii]
LFSFIRCSISPIRKDDEAVQHPSTSHATKPHSLALTRRSSKSMQLVEADQVDREARAWLKACERTPYLSSDWLNHLTSSYRDKAEQRAKERELAEAKLRHCEKQLELSHRWRMENLEQRLACLLLTPPVLVDPYLVPQPIPIELPFKPTSRLVPPALPELTESQWSEMEALLRSGPPDTVLVENFRLSVTRKELLTLTSTNWLSDMVINFYMQLLYCRSQNQSNGGKNRILPRIAVLSTFFYAKLMSTVGGGYAGVRRWSRQLKLLDQDLVLIPIHDRGMHWCLACIDFRTKTITYYDSMGSPNIKCLQSLKDYLEEECKDKKGHPLPDSDTWELVNTEDSVPQQMNGSDCGVFMCTYGEFLSRNAKFTFSQVSQFCSGFCYIPLQLS